MKGNRDPKRKEYNSDEESKTRSSGKSRRGKGEEDQPGEESSGEGEKEKKSLHEKGIARSDSQVKIGKDE